MASDSNQDADAPHGGMIDRPRGILSKADRKYLVRPPRARDEAYSRQGRNSRRSAIAERLENSLLDMYLLYDRLSDDDLREIFNGDPPNLSAAVGLFYRIAALDDTAPPEDKFRGWLRTGITDVLEEQATGIETRAASVEFDVNPPEVINLEGLEKKLDSEGPGALTQNELLFILYLTRRDPEATEDLEAGAMLDAIADHLDDEWGLKEQLILPPDVYEPDVDDDDGIPGDFEEN